MKRYVLTFLALLGVAAIGAVNTTVQRDVPYSIPSAAAHTATATASTATVTIAAPGGNQSNVISGIAWSYSADPTGGHIAVKDGATTVFEMDITTGGAGFLPVVRRGSTNTAMTVVLSSGGGGIVGYVNVVHVWNE